MNQHVGLALDPDDRLRFERLLQWLRLSFLVAPALVLVAFGRPAALYAALIAIAVAGSYTWVWLLLRFAPHVLLRSQPLLRLLDCGLVYLVLANYHGFLRNAYYDSVYLLFVVAAAATHGRRGTVLVALVSGIGVLAGRLQLMFLDGVPFELRHLTDSVFFTIFFLITGLAVAFLMDRSGEVAARRDRAWRAALAERNRVLQEIADARDRALDDARAAINTRDDVLTIVSHDLKNPLTAFSATVQSLQLELSRKGAVSPDRLAARVSRLDVAVRKMRRIVDELLDVT
ncbi:MAG: hypothetical protein HY332_05220 [Chloroflexi bacterium]|nr:hypothetical protein [Chloroflexota bacterium]